MVRVVMMREHGGPEVLRIEDVAVGEPGPGQVRLRQSAVGVNFHDIYVRTGLYRTLELPGIPGIEAVGVVEAVGPGVTGVAAGDRVGYVTRTYGAYAAARLVDADLLIRLPDAVDDRTAASLLLRGLTAEMLLFQVYPVRAGQTVLVHAAAGGVGRLLCRWARHLGATVIGTVGSPEKAAIARTCGAHHTIEYRSEDFVARVAQLTGGRGVDVAYDAVGKDTFAGSLQCLAPLGHLANYGQASGPCEPLAMTQLAQKSNSVSRPIIFHYVADAGRRATMAARLLAAIADGVIGADERHEYAFADVGRAQADMEARRTSGAVILVP